ncbi:MAG: hypothetical protein WBE76_01295 [Terracidiphilus sp.]
MVTRSVLKFESFEVDPSLGELRKDGEDAQRYALRHDAPRRYLTSEEERRASQLLLLMLAGHRNVGAPWQVEFLL